MDIFWIFVQQRKISEPPWRDILCLRASRCRWEKGPPGGQEMVTASPACSLARTCKPLQIDANSSWYIVALGQNYVPQKVDGLMLLKMTVFLWAHWYLKFESPLHPSVCWFHPARHPYFWWVNSPRLAIKNAMVKIPNLNRTHTMYRDLSSHAFVNQLNHYTCLPFTIMFMEDRGARYNES